VTPTDLPPPFAAQAGRVMRDTDTTDGVRMRDLCRLLEVCCLCVLLMLMTACSRKVKDYPVPPNAQSVAGLRYVTLKKGDGRYAMEGGIWGVESKLVSHTERNCEYPCKRSMLYRRFSRYLEPWNPVVKTMREGEIRRVWLKRPDHAEPAVFEIELASVVRTDRAGEPIIDNR
jgi:hypothetical protein